MQGLSYVVLDLETTGIEEGSEIIEIAMVKVEEGIIIAKYEQLLQPKNPIPEEITLLTGITNSMVSNKPFFQEIADQVLDFIGDNIIVAHNVNFDRRFLFSALGNKIANYWVDSCDIAKITLPTLASYKLSHIASYLNVKNRGFHRALFDAECTALILEKLIDESKKIPPHVFEKIISLLSTNNDLTFFLRKIHSNNLTNYFVSPSNLKSKERENKKKGEIIDFNEADTLLKPGGLFERNYPAYEYRPQQLQMLNTVTKAFKENKHAIIEAGTGTGKSIAYLIPGILWSIKTKSPVVIATNTIALQEQLKKFDIPNLENCLGLKLVTCLMKGRNNYLCLRKFNSLVKNNSFKNEQERIFYARLLSWLERTSQGDKEELNINRYDSEYWLNISAEKETCLGYKCSYHLKCYYYKNRRTAENSNIIVVNHSLLLQNIKMDEKILPAYDYAIIDEAHNLEGEALNQFTRTVNFYDFNAILHKLIKVVLPSLKNQFLQQSGEIDLAVKIQNDTKALLREISEVIIKVQHNKISLIEEIRITPIERNTQWWNNLVHCLQEIIGIQNSLLFNLRALINKLEVSDFVSEDFFKEINSLYLRISDFMEVINEFVSQSLKDYVYWFKIPKNNFILNISPIFAKDNLKEFFSEKKSIILVSATIAINNDFTHFIETVGLEEDRLLKLVTDTPFDFQNQSVICIPNDISSPTTNSTGDYIKDCGEFISNVIPTSPGGVLILFTSFQMLNHVYHYLKNNSDINNKTILAQGKDGSRSYLVQALKNNPQDTIVLGADSFWEGIDISGLGLTTIIMTRLPFAPPTRPINAAKIELLEKEKINSFQKFSLPTALIKFRQGYGRLIRNQKDWGTLIILDKRIIEKSYGKLFLQSLPKQQLVVDDSQSICHFLKKWMVNKTPHNHKLSLLNNT